MHMECSESIDPQEMNEKRRIRGQAWFDPLFLRGRGGRKDLSHLMKFFGELWRCTSSRSFGFVYILLIVLVKKLYS